MTDLQGRLDAIVKAYDIRGTHPEQFDAEVAARLGAEARSWVRGNGTTDRMITGTMAVYRSLVARGGRARVTGA